MVCNACNQHKHYHSADEAKLLVALVGEAASKTELTKDNLVVLKSSARLPRAEPTPPARVAIASWSYRYNNEVDRRCERSKQDLRKTKTSSLTPRKIQRMVLDALVDRDLV